MNPAQSRQENVALPEAGTGDPDHIWIFREGAARADNFRLSTLPADVDDVAGFIHHIKNHYSVAYASVEADEIVIKDKATGAQLDPAVKLSGLAGNTSTTPYPVKVKGDTTEAIRRFVFFWMWFFFGVGCEIWSIARTNGDGAVVLTALYAFTSQIRALQKASEEKWFGDGWNGIKAAVGGWFRRH